MAESVDVLEKMKLLCCEMLRKFMQIDNEFCVLVHFKRSTIFRHCHTYSSRNWFIYRNLLEQFRHINAILKKQIFFKLETNESVK